ncbi:MAG: HIT family protein [Clostridiales bacterium]|nr:HIT family protein [Clostridiales bacterium]
MDCIFCAIEKGEMPAYKLYEDDDFFVILDKFPHNRGESLVITKQHYDNVFNMPPQLVGAAFSVGQKVAATLKGKLGAEGVNLLQNNGRAAGQMINHFHLHVIPRYNGDDMKIGGSTIKQADEEFVKICDILKLE